MRQPAGQQVGREQEGDEGERENAQARREDTVESTESRVHGESLATGRTAEQRGLRARSC
jgi:hypothetical protein